MTNDRKMVSYFYCKDMHVRNSVAEMWPIVDFLRNSVVHQKLFLNSVCHSSMMPNRIFVLE